MINPLPLHHCWAPRFITYAHCTSLSTRAALHTVDLGISRFPTTPLMRTSRTSSILTSTLPEPMAANLNSYADQNRPELDEMISRLWVEVSATELGTWICMAIYMAALTIPSLSDYWKNDGIWHFHDTSEFLSQTKFKQITRYFHIAFPWCTGYFSRGQTAMVHQSGYNIEGTWYLLAELSHAIY